LKKLLTGLLFIGIASLAHGDYDNRYFGSLEGFGTGTIDKNYKDDTQDILNSLTAGGFASKGSVKTTAGFGGRFGTFFPVENDFEVGASLGYISGPTITQTITATDFLGTPIFGETKDKIETSFLRVLFEAGKIIPLSQSVYLRLAGGAGVARGMAKESFTATGDFAPVFANSTHSEDWTGFTWEVGPSIVLPTPDAEYEFGLHYAQFPKKDASSMIDKLEWQPLSFYAGVRFGGPSTLFSPKSSAAPVEPQVKRDETAAQREAYDKARTFIIAGYPNIMKDLPKGEGPYLTSLFDLLKIEPAVRPEATRKIHGLSEVYSNISDFADHVLELYPPIVEPQSSEVASPKKNETREMSIEELRVYFHSMPQGSKVTIVTKASGQSVNVIFDRFDPKNFDLILCCTENVPCQPGSGDVLIWLPKVRTASRQ
jgi:hypothetical protein